MLQKHEAYYRETRKDLISLVPEGANKVLEIGCGEGNTGRALKDSGRAVEVVGVEKDTAAARLAEGRIDKVICGDIEAVELPYGPGWFDYILAGDVLEHLYDPWAVVDKLGTYLRPGGGFLASIPNVRFWRIALDLVLKGKWDYAPDGVLDDTHVRFFTRKSMAKLFKPERFHVCQMIPSFRFQAGAKARMANRLTLGLCEDLWALMYIIEARRR